MTSSTSKDQGDGVFDYLCVDHFIENIIQARALSTAFENGLIDNLLRRPSLSFQSLAQQGGRDRRGMMLLLGMLQANGIIENQNGEIKLSAAFVQAMKYRDLLELKSALANLAAHDFLDYFTDLVHRPDQFLQKVKYCRLFAYDRCFSRSRENEEATRRWMRITTILTKYEAPVCMHYHDFGPYRKILDIGGNSGEFVLRICRKYREIHASVLDLPLVCEIGRQHLQAEPEADRISFIQGNALTDVLPGGFDLITFKSMLHDWPERDAMRFITNASQALAPGGRLLIFERGPIEVDKAAVSYPLLPMLLFFHSFRSPEIYENHLRRMGFYEIFVKRIELEMPFILVTAKKK